ncbi:hypothetical protein BKA64DRAFT_639367 [Cadophora sp. MPI-SDFR-AT-0126]|nr:hypothetical protein BKA64DRAFT_639367 [Leotiomycetes sp. MPI-SDFR-AT-0126]
MFSFSYSGSSRVPDGFPHFCNHFPIPFCRSPVRSLRGPEPQNLRATRAQAEMFIAYKLSLDYHADCLDFLDRRRGRQKLNKEAGTIEGWEVSYNLGYHRIRPFESFRRTRTSQIQAMLLAERRIILPSRTSPDPRNHGECRVYCGKTRLTEVDFDTSFTSGEARQRPGHVVGESTTSQSSGLLATRDGDGATTRHIARRLTRCEARNLANARQIAEGPNAYKKRASSVPEVEVEISGLLERKEDEQAMEPPEFYTPRKRRWARVHALGSFANHTDSSIDCH